jgi:hypothetical protein
MVFGVGNSETETGIMPSAEAFAAMEKFNEQLMAAGVLVDGGGLKPSSVGKRVLTDGDRRMVVDGPFTETKEVIAGYMIWNVKDIDEAVEWVKKAPSLGSCPAVTEIRPIYGPEDFADLVPTDQ